MSSTYLDLNYHLVFSTKNRIPWIHPVWSKQLHRYMGGTVRGLGGVPLQINGVDDHVHLLVGLRATHCLSDFMRELKKASSIWIHKEVQISEFRWQTGYAAFSVSSSLKNSVRNYILRQELHHRHCSFTEELVKFLQLMNIEFDPRFLD